MSQSEALPPDNLNQLPDKQSDDEPIDYDWRDPSKPRNAEDDVIAKGWRRRADGTYERVDNQPYTL